MKHFALVAAMAICAAANTAEEVKVDAPANKEALARRIATLIQELDDADFNKREVATVALIEIGEPSHAPVKQVLANPPSTEVQYRAARIDRAVAKQIREKRNPGGEAVGGLQATLISECDTFSPDDKIVFQLQIKNVGDKARDYVAIHFFDHTMPGYKSSSSGSHARVVLKQISGDKFPEVGCINGCGSGPLRIVTELKAGERACTEVDIGGKKPLPKGEYEVYVVYFAQSRQLLKDLKADLQSNAVRFKVE